MTKHASKHDTIVIGGVDISNHVYGYNINAKVGEVYTITLHLHDDPDLIRINGKPAVPQK